MTAARAEEILIEIRNTLDINAEEVFSMIDKLQIGYITLRTFQNWLKDALGFHLNEFENKIVLSRYDKDQDYRISKEEFVDEVNLVNMP